jgi:bacteriocin biosynthesis cyclodehydratase domain-containing protein
MSAPTAEAALNAAECARVPLPRAPRLAPWITVVDLGDDRLELRAAEFAHTLRHPLFRRAFLAVRSRLDGRHSVAEIAAAAGPEVLPSTVVFLLKVLQANGVLQEGAADGERDGEELARWGEQVQFLSHFTADPWAAQDALRAATVALVGRSPLTARLREELGAAGVGEVLTVETGDASAILSADGRGTARARAVVDLLVASFAAADVAAFSAVNAACLEAGTRWLHVAARGSAFVFGPTVVPRQTACYACYDARLGAHLADPDAEAAYRRQTGGRGVEEGSFPALCALVAGHVAAEVVRILTAFAPPATIGRCYEIGAARLTCTGHDVLRVPRCPSCGATGPRPEPFDAGVGLEGAA